ncbi:MAG: phospholipase D-like domain-containing protein, partial [Methanomassiliicoccales archaeon]|nr:phospholipase D-like domain-containing protein [Methanomassiliicoccales archaeon]
DELLLADTSGVLVDVVAYGDSDYSGTGWEGKPVAKPPKAHEIRRMTKDAADTNTSSDWLIVPPGRSAFSQIATKALVEPFLAPEDARSRLIREFEYSSRSICAAVYELNDPNVVSALVSAAKRGVNVRVLLEGQPVGGISENGRQAASELDVAGVEVSFLKSRDGYKRYDYLHCKYAVIDGRRSIVMSENWVTNGIDRNRGWGVVVESRELASYMARMFWHDCDNRSLDVCPIENVIGERDYEGGLVELGPTVSDIGNLKRFEASVGPLVSPDFSLERLSNLIDSAKSQILVEQFYCAPSWLGSDGLVSGLFSAASKGVTVRILLDSSWFNSGETRNNSKVVEYLNQRASDMGVDLEARLVSKYHPFEMIHNKGVVIDDVSIVSSMNWVDASFKENREIGIEIRSEEVSSYFSDAFWEDWKTDPYPPIVNLSFKTLTVHEGTPVWLDASKSTDNAGISRILWDEGADGSVEWDGPRHLVKLGCGNHVIAVAVIDVFNNSAFSVVEIRVLPVEDPGSADVLLLLPFVGTAGFLIWRILKKIKTG